MADIDRARQAIYDAQANLDVALAALDEEPVPEEDYQARTDTEVAPKPPPLALGPAPFVFTDPTFGSTLIRLTDERTAGGVAIHSASNAHVAVWSSDGARHYGMKGTGGSIFFTFEAQRQRTRVDPIDVDRIVGLRGPKGTDPIDVGSYVEPSFSYEDPHTVICCGGDNHRTIYAVDLRTGGRTLLCDLDQAYDFMAGVGGYCNALVTARRSWVIAFGGQAQDEHHFIHYQRDDGFTAGQDLYQWGCHIHSVALDQSGRYVMIYTTSADIQAGRPKCYVWDVETGTMTGLLGEEHHVWGHDSQGYGCSINNNTASGQYDGMQWVKRQLAQPAEFANVLPQTLQPPKTYIEDHSSWRNCSEANTEPFFSFTWRHDTDQTPWRAWDDEILAVKPDGAAVYRFCHHQAIGGDQEFWDQALGHARGDGRWVSFSSNWGKTLGAGRQDLFLLHAR